MASSTRENVAHYNTGEIETIDYIADKLSREEFRAYVLANIIKYASRANHKGQFASDLEKIRNYAVILQEYEAKYVEPVDNLTVPLESHTFKVGDKVRLRPSYDIPPPLEYCAVYSIEYIDDEGFLYFEGQEDSGWFGSRFEGVE